MCIGQAGQTAQNIQIAEVTTFELCDLIMKANDEMKEQEEELPNENNELEVAQDHLPKAWMFCAKRNTSQQLSIDIQLKDHNTLISAFAVSILSTVFHTPNQLFFALFLLLTSMSCQVPYTYTQPRIRVKNS